MSENEATPSRMTAPRSRFNSQHNVIDKINTIQSLISEKKQIDKRDLQDTLDLALMTLNSRFMPEDSVENLDKLSKNLDEEIPPKKLDQNLIIASWNIRRFGDINPNWKSKSSDRQRRDLFACYIIAEIVSRFDVIAIQEITGPTIGLKKILEILGPNWDILLTNVNYGPLGNNERIAFLYDTRRVNTSGLACQLIAPNMGAEVKTAWQFARLPYVVGFRSGRKSFTLVSPHIRFGGVGPQQNPERKRELETLAKVLAKWAKSPYAWDKNIIALGDFNITDKELFNALTSEGLFVPEEIQNAPKFLFETKSVEDKYRRMYCLIAFFPQEGDVPHLTLPFKNGGAYKFDKAEFAAHIREQNKGDYLRSLSCYISDHRPIWAEFSLFG
jgi:hypothetical protein